MNVRNVYFWQQSPLVRLLLPFSAGILLQWYTGLPAGLFIFTGLGALIVTAGFFLLPFIQRYRLSVLNGLTISLVFICTGALLTHYQDVRNSTRWFGHIYTDSTTVLATLLEPPVEKTKSFKAEAAVTHTGKGQAYIPASGKIIVYFKKDTLLPPPSYGTTLLFKKPLQSIRSPGNPGSFDYRRYTLFHGITHQVYLQPGEFEIVGNKQDRLTTFIYTVRRKILAILRSNIQSEKELGLAEALLIGYKDDLDKSLVQSYSNTGVVHIIAISGLHLGLIYWLLLRLFQPLRRKKKLQWLAPLLTIAGLWLFTLLAGAQPSVLRSALMFSCIVAGESLTRRTTIYNTLALSAFILLCYNPYWLWDVGFQLSYAAVLSIVIFMRPVYNWFYFDNKALDMIWKLCSVTLAAQILTLPFIIYHFHQFPVYFLLTNLVAVPLSSAILVGEIFLCMVSFIPAAAMLTGNLLTWLIRLMNSFVEYTESLPFSSWNALQISQEQAALLFIFIAGIAFWLMRGAATGLKTGLIALLAFMVLRAVSFAKAGLQHKLIVYNIPRYTAIDLVSGRSYFFTGDRPAEDDELVRNFHLQPSRVLHRVAASASPATCTLREGYIGCGDKRILLLDRTIAFRDTGARQPLDLLILSKNPRLYISDLAASFTIRQVVFDSSVPAWKIRYWKKDCDSLHIPYHDVAMQGAFVMNLQ